MGNCIAGNRNGYTKQARMSLRAIAQHKVWIVGPHPPVGIAADMETQGIEAFHSMYSLMFSKARWRCLIVGLRIRSRALLLDAREECGAAHERPVPTHDSCIPEDSVVIYQSNILPLSLETSIALGATSAEPTLASRDVRTKWMIWTRAAAAWYRMGKFSFHFHLADKRGVDK